MPAIKLTAIATSIILAFSFSSVSFAKETKINNDGVATPIIQKNTKTSTTPHKPLPAAGKCPSFPNC
ncbi:hypothetical protein [Gloeothece verrucosa]|uniref:Uncharacterized protein n=1 Tax=Gloeothece verrucosa (strain PCC 7822) TaxID=497965 RepID=E0UG29_GLOV7|nr:hypothetical protein [Gloeothece verrucosa]ADN15530.1 conserved hypothetical protein [Gloeothece verrucosa PCC 7822]